MPEISEEELEAYRQLAAAARTALNELLPPYGYGVPGSSLSGALAAVQRLQEREECLVAPELREHKLHWLTLGTRENAEIWSFLDGEKEPWRQDGKHYTDAAMRRIGYRWIAVAEPPRELRSREEIWETFVKEFVKGGSFYPVTTTFKNALMCAFYRCIE